MKLYRHLAWDGIRKNSRLYVPYLLTGVGAVSFFYILVALSRLPEGTLPGSGSVQVILNLGSFVLWVFSLLLLFYTHSFLIRRRNRAFALYNVLGMGKGDISRILCWESLLSGGLSLLGGLALGVVRNDNAPGATANSFADRQTRADGARYGESQWQAFGVELMQRDLALRKKRFEEDSPELALNLPVEDIQKAHDDAFMARGIHPSAWTPYKLLEAARAYGGARKPKLSGPCCWTTIGWAWTGWRKPAGWSSASTRT